MASAGKPLRGQLRGQLRDFCRVAHAYGIDPHHLARRLGEQQRDQHAERQEKRNIRQRILGLVVDEGDECEGRCPRLATVGCVNEDREDRVRPNSSRINRESSGDSPSGDWEESARSELD
jgi:hypothetical protein